MTTTPAEVDDPLATAAPPSYTATVAPRATWRRLRAPVAIGLLLVVTAFALVSQRQRVRVGEFDPESVEPGGARAIAQLLRDRGVDVDRVQGLPAELPTSRTVFAPFAAELPPERLTPLLSPPPGTDVVLVGPRRILDVLGTELTGVAGAGDEARAPGCEFAPAATAGAATMPGHAYEVGDGAGTTLDACYPIRGRPGLVHVRRGDASVTVLGAGSVFTNARIAEDGNAALALGLLDRGKPVTWVLRGAPGSAPPEQAQGLWDLLPDGVYFGLLQLLFAAFVAMLWRGRRLGPVVTEPLPVVVRAAEAVEGRGRLYAAAKARDRAGWNLRRGARERLRSRLGMPPDTGHESLVAGTSARSAREPNEIGRLLYGPDPVDDAALVRLAADLDYLDSEVRRS